MDTPLIVRIDEAKKSIVEFINDIMQQHQLPCYFLEPVISEIYAGIKEGAKNELEIARQQMKNDNKQKTAKQQTKKQEVVE